MHINKPYVADESSDISEIASILAAGLNRWHEQELRVGAQESPLTGLEVSPDTVLSGTNPVNGPESRS